MKNSLDEMWENLTDEEYKTAYRITKLTIIDKLKEFQDGLHKTTMRTEQCKVTGYPRLNWEIDYCLDNEGFSHGRIFRLEEDDGLGHLTISETTKL